MVCDEGLKADPNRGVRLQAVRFLGLRSRAKG